VCGGDGSQRTAAIVLAGSSTPLLPIHGGTRNHFARALGLCDLEAAGTAARGANVVRVDLGDVNGEVFVNNASIGFYAALVRERERHEGHRPKRVADVVAAWEQARRGHRFPVEVDGSRHRAWLVFVGNGCYGSSLFDLAERESLDDGRLDLRLVKAERRLARVRVVAALLTGRLGRSPVLAQVVDSEVQVAVLDVAAVDVALDGEVTKLSTPLCFRSRAGALRVLVP
jgi:undecaprenyl-diphosphatase